MPLVTIKLLDNVDASDWDELHAETMHRLEGQPLVRVLLDFNRRIDSMNTQGFDRLISMAQRHRIGGFKVAMIAANNNPDYLANNVDHVARNKNFALEVMVFSSEKIAKIWLAK